MKRTFVPRLLIILGLMLIGAMPVMAQPARSLEPNAAPLTATTARLLVAHLAPFAADASVTVRVNGADLLTNFGFGDTAGYLSLPAGDYLVEILPTGTATVAISGTVSLEAGKDYTAAALGGPNSQPLELLALEDDNTLPLAGNAKVRVVHAAPFAADLDATRVSIRTEAGAVVGGLDSVPYKGFSDYLELPSGAYDLKIATPDGATTLIDIPPLELLAGDIVTVFAIGDGANQDLGVLPVYGASIEPARLLVAHLAPFAAGAASVTVRANGEDLLTNFTFGTTAGYVDLPAGDYFVEILPTGTATVAISGTVSLQSGRDYTAAAIGGANSQPLELLALADDNRAPAAGKAKVRVVHAAPFAADLDATRVSIRTEAGAVVGGLSSVPYKGVSPYLELDAGAYDLKIATPDGATTLIDIPPLTLAAGDIVTIFAIGDGANQDLGVLPVAGSERAPARVLIAHLAPFATGAASVTVRANGADLLTNFGFGDTTGYLNLPAGSYIIAIIPTGATSPALTTGIEVVSGRDYTAAAIGGANSQPLELLALADDNRAPAAGKAKVRVVHAAPFAADLDATRVSIRTEAGAVVGGLGNVPYKGVSPYLELDAGAYDLKIATPDGATTLIDIPPFVVTPGEVMTVFAIGDGTNQSLGILAIENVGPATRIYLPIARR